MREPEGIGILSDVEPPLDLPAELRGADLGADCLRLFLAVAMDCAIRIAAAAASNKTVGFSFGSFISQPSHKGNIRQNRAANIITAILAHRP